jgi:hypothetical protein
MLDNAIVVNYNRNMSQNYNELGWSYRLRVEDRETSESFYAELTLNYFNRKRAYNAIDFHQNRRDEMKTRNDFVTNSSTTVYYISRNTKPISDETKIAIADAVMDGFIEAYLESADEIEGIVGGVDYLFYEIAQKDLSEGRIASIAKVPVADDEWYYYKLIEKALAVLAKTNELEFKRVEA